MSDAISFAQMRMCILDALDFRAPDNMIWLAWRIRGPFNTAALRAAVDNVIRRNATLRTRYVITDGKPTAIIDQEPSARFTVQDAMHATNEDALQEIASPLVHLPYRLSWDPVMRTFVLRLPGNEIVLIIVIHHIAVDGVSMVTLVDEISEFYSAFVSGRPPALPEVEVEYADYAAWQREWVRGQEAGRQLAYWRQALAGMEELELPADHPRRAGRSANGRAIQFAFGQELSAQISKVSREHRVTVFMFLVAAFKVVLSRYAGQEDISVGIPVDGRGKPEFEDIIGLFVNTVVLRTRARHDLTFAEYLRAVRQATFSAIENRNVPFDLVVQELRPKRDLSRNPFFEVLFTFDSTGPAVLRLDGLEVEEFTVQPRVSQLELGVEMSVSTDGIIGGQMLYAADLFEPSTIGRLSEHYTRVLCAVTARPDVRLGEIELMHPAERAAVLKWAVGPTVARSGGLVHELFEQQAATAPADIAVIHDKHELSYQRLNGDANQLAHYLVALGVTLDEPVGILLPRGKPPLTTLLAVLKAGGVYLSLDPALPDERISRTLAEVGAAAVLTDSTLVSRITTRDIPVVTIDPDQPGIARQPRTNPAVPISADNLAYIIDTSVSSSDPEMAAIPHRALLNTVMWSSKHHNLKRTDRIVSRNRVPGGALVWEMLTPLAVGAALLMAPEGSYSREHPTDHGKENDAVILQMVSPAECATYAAAGWWNACETGSAAIGTPIENVVARVLDSEMNLVPPGLRGVLYLGGEGLGRGYLRNPRRTAERFVPDPYGPPGARLYTTGDVFRNDEAGFLTFISRSDRQVKLLGRRVQLQEIESAVAALPTVSKAAVVLDGPETTPRLVCYVIPEGEADLSPRTLKQAMREVLPSYMIPNVFVALPEMPSTLCGKTDYSRLQEMCGAL